MYGHTSDVLTVLALLFQVVIAMSGGELVYFEMDMVHLVVLLLCCLYW